MKFFDAALTPLLAGFFFFLDLKTGVLKRTLQSNV
jgi:hypothetical protein